MMDVDVQKILDGFSFSKANNYEALSIIATLAEAAGMVVSRTPAGVPFGELYSSDEDEDNPKRTNAEWAFEQIQKHGVDRYPTVYMQLAKLMEEVGELAKEINKEGPTGITPNYLEEAKTARGKVRRETADVALALYNLCAKLNVNLDEQIKLKVQNDERRFV